MTADMMAVICDERNKNVISVTNKKLYDVLIMLYASLCLFLTFNLPADNILLVLSTHINHSLPT